MDTGDREQTSEVSKKEKVEEEELLQELKAVGERPRHRTVNELKGKNRKKTFFQALFIHDLEKLKKNIKKGADSGSTSETSKKNKTSQASTDAKEIDVNKPMDIMIRKDKGDWIVEGGGEDEGDEKEGGDEAKQTIKNSNSNGKFRLRMKGSITIKASDDGKSKVDLEIEGGDHTKSGNESTSAEKQKLGMNEEGTFGDGPSEKDSNKGREENLEVDKEDDAEQVEDASSKKLKTMAHSETRSTYLKKSSHKNLVETRLDRETAMLGKDGKILVEVRHT